MNIDQHIKLSNKFKKEYPDKKILDNRKSFYTSEYVGWLYNQLTIEKNKNKKY